MGAAKRYAVSVEVSITVPLTLSLTNKEAKAICADSIDPNESWASQATDCLESCLDMDLFDAIEEQIATAIPADLTAEIQGVTLQLKSTDGPTVEILGIEVGEE